MVVALLSSMLEVIETIVAEETNQSEEAKQRGRLVGDVAKEIQLVSIRLEKIIAVLDAENKLLITDRDIKDWIDELTGAAYELVDALDKLITTLRITGVRKTSNLKVKVGSFVIHCYCTGQCVLPGNLHSKLKKISISLRGIVMRSDSLELQMRSAMQHRRWSSTPVFHVSELIGRDEIKGDIVSSLLYGSTEKESELLKTISVVGMAGVGKTAIAQLVYNDEEVKHHFDSRIWVFVSDLFSEKNVAKAIIAEVEHFAVDSLDSFPLVTLHERIHKSIKGKKFFLVLDDVWADDMQDWERLIQTFKHGAPGSRILLTTPKDTVANMMKDSCVFHLEVLSDEHCWMVLRQSAFYGMGVEECRNLEDIGKRISKRCKGLPLAAKTLGCLLRFKSSREEWEDILNIDEIWEFETAEKNIFAALLLSYKDLPLPLRECFKYCAIFPKNFVYDGETIIYHWMAQGYLGWDNGEDLELRGREYISYLAARSFFQDFIMDKHGLNSTWKMHDIMHDFAQFLMRNNGIVIEVNRGGNSMIDLYSTKARYVTALIPEGCYLPTSINGAENLHSLVIISGENAITNEAVQIIFNQAKQLRLVDFGCHNSLMDTIPKEIRNLIHLRHINFSGSKITGLPGSLCELLNLQYLNLNSCESLENLPDEIGNLINLRYVGTLHCCRLACYPKSARRLTNLRQLHGIVLRADRNDLKEFALGDLENLNHLCELSMVLKGNAVDDRELKRAKFENKTQLKEIKVE